MWPSSVWSIQRYHFYRRHKFAGSPREPESSPREFWEMRRQHLWRGRARIRNIWTSASLDLCEQRDRGHGVERKIHERNFYRHTDILTLLLVVTPLARARATHRSVWALFYDGKPSNADRFTRKQLFAPFRRACGRPIRRRNNEPEMGRRSLSGFSRTEAAGVADYGRTSIVSPAASAIRSSGFRWPEPAAG